MGISEGSTFLTGAALGFPPAATASCAEELRLEPAITINPNRKTQQRGLLKIIRESIPSEENVFNLPEEAGNLENRSKSETPAIP
jgi:hypothetical protein